MEVGVALDWDVVIHSVIHVHGAVRICDPQVKEDESPVVTLAHARIKPCLEVACPTALIHVVPVFA